MAVDTAVPGDEGLGRHGAASRARPSPVPGGVPLGVRLTAGEAANAGPALAAFLAEPDIAAALALWFGGPVSRSLADERGAVLAALDRDIAAIDALLSAQANAVLHHPRFQRLEASWRGVRYLADQADPDDGVKVRILQLPWAELCRDLERAIEFDQSQLFGKIYSEEFGMPGGEPFGVLLGDYEVLHKRAAGHPSDDVAALKGMSQVAAAAFTPFVVGCLPGMFGVDRFRELGIHVDLGSTFNQLEYLRWRSLQESDDARFIAVVLPRVLMRLPYRDDGSRVDGFRFAEEVTAAHHDAYLWGSAIFAFGAVLIRSFVSSGWFAEIRGAPRDVIGGGLATDLPISCFETDSAHIAQRYSTDLCLSELQDVALSELGFMPLRKCKDTDYSAFFATPSVHVPKKYDRFVANINARLSSMLQYVLCVSRVSHYIKVIGRDRVGSFATAAECEALLMGWLRKYTLGNDDASYEMKAKYPLREASVQVRDVPGQPGSFRSIIHLRPHFQLEQVVTSFKLVTELTGASPH